MRNVLKIANVTTVQYIKQGTFRYVEQVGEENKGIRYSGIISSFIEAEAFYKSDGTPEISNGDVIYYYQSIDKTWDFADTTATNRQIGIFTVSKCVYGKDTYSFIAYDNIEKLNIDFSAKLLSMKNQFPMDIVDFLDEVEAFANSNGASLQISTCNCYYNTETNNINYFYANGITLRDILSYFADFNMQFVRCKPYGAIFFDQYSIAPRTLNNPWLRSDRYIIAPTDQVTYTGTLDGTQTVVNLVPVFYKENGLNKEGYSFAPVDDFQIIGIDGDIIVRENVNTPLSDITNPYTIFDNIVANAIDDYDPWWDECYYTNYYVLEQLLLTRNITPFEVHLFPFRNPFTAGQIIKNIVDTKGNRTQSVVMKMELTDSEVILSCSGSEKYYVDGSKNYDVAGQTTSLAAAINGLEESKVSKSGDTITGNLNITGGLTLSTPLAVTSGGTGATNQTDALNNLNGVRRYLINAGSGISTSVKRRLSFSGAVLGLLYVTGSSSARCGLYILSAGTSTVIVEPVKAATACTITTGTGYFDITSTSGTLYATILTAQALNRISETAAT